MSRFKVGFDADELSRFFRDWIKRNGDGRDSEGMRFGQLLCNYYLVSGATFPELFNEESAYEAYVKAYNELKIH